MTRMILLLSAVLMTACGPTEDRKVAESFRDVPSVEELASDVERLKELRRQCKTERPTMGDVLCNRVAEATNKRFFGDGNVPYTLPETSPKF